MTSSPARLDPRGPRVGATIAAGTLLGPSRTPYGLLAPSQATGT